MPSLRQPRPVSPAWDESQGAQHAAAFMALIGQPAMPAVHGNCYGEDPETFFPDEQRGHRGEAAAIAKAICAGCPIKPTCLALGQGEEGIWGGTTRLERERARLSTAA